MIQPPPETARIFNRKIREWFLNNGRSFPWRETRDPYRILISEVLLQRTRADQVVPVYVRLIDSYPNVIALSRADESDLRAVINPLGLAKRAEYLIKLANRLVSEFDGIVPGDRNALLNLPGIGAYTANAVLSFAFNMPYPVIDSNVIRVFRRFFNLDYSGHKPNRSISELARSLLNDSDSRSYNYGLLDFASEVCRTRDPLCPLCILRNHCRYSGSS